MSSITSLIFIDINTSLIFTSLPTGYVTPLMLHLRKPLSLCVYPTPSGQLSSLPALSCPSLANEQSSSCATIIKLHVIGCN